jgi:S1-C subfamily serine protease
VTDVVAGKAAANGGIKKDDVITNFAGKKVSSVDALRFAVDAKHPGDVVQVTLLRDGQSRTVSVTLSTRPNNP